MVSLHCPFKLMNFQTSLRELHLTVCDANYTQTRLYIYTHKAVFVAALVYENDASDVCLLSNHITPLLKIRKWYSMVETVRPSTRTCWHASHLAFADSNSSPQFPLTCPGLSCGFRLWAFTQAVVSICSALSACFCLWQTHVSVEVLWLR